MQVILWVILGGTLAVAQLVVRHRQLVGSVELAGTLTADLPGGVAVGVRLPKGWHVEHDAGEHPGDAGAAREFNAIEPAGGVGGVPDPEAGEDFARQLSVRFQPLRDAEGARAFIDRTGLLADTVELAGGAGEAMAVADVQGVWIPYGRPVRVLPGHGPLVKPEYLAVGIVPAGPMTPVPVAVTLVLECPFGDTDVKGDRDLLERVAAAVTVEQNRAPAVPSARVTPTVR